MAACSWFPWQRDAGAEREMERERDRAKKERTVEGRSVANPHEIKS